MSYQATVYNVMISGPSDVKDERYIAHSAIHAWNAAHSEYRGITLIPLDYEPNSVPEWGEHPQTILNRQLIDDRTDLIIAVFKHTLGTETENEESGTVEEINRCHAAGKHVMVYFSEENVPPNVARSDQYRKLCEFKDSCQKKGLYRTYRDCAHLKEQLGQHIATLINRISPKKGTDQSVEYGSITIDEFLDGKSQEEMPDDAKKILYAAATGDGKIRCKTWISGEFHVGAGGTSFDSNCQPKKEAELKEAVRTLEDSGLIRATNTKRENFEVTVKGHEVAEKISSKPDSPTVQNIYLQDIDQRILKAAYSGDGLVNTAEAFNDFSIVAGSKEFHSHNEPAKESELREAIQRLQVFGSIQPMPGAIGAFWITPEGRKFVETFLGVNE